MNTLVKPIAGIVLVLFMARFGAGQLLTGPYDEACPTRLMFVESTFRMAVDGVVMQVIDGRSLRLVLDDKTSLIAELGGIDTSKLSRRSSQEEKEFLQQNVLGKHVSLLVEASPRIEKPRPRKITASINVMDVAGHDLALQLLRMGLAQYKEPKADSISIYNRCVYREAEKEAQQQRRGIWN